MYTFSFSLTGYLVKEATLNLIKDTFCDCVFKFDSSIFSLEVTVQINVFDHETAVIRAAAIERFFLIDDPGASRNSKLEYTQNLDEKRRLFLRDLIPPAQFQQFDLLRKK